MSATTTQPYAAPASYAVRGPDTFGAHPHARAGRDSHASWFGQSVRPSHADLRPSYLSTVPRETQAEMVVVRRAHELAPAIAGAVAGSFGGAAMLGTAWYVARTMHAAGTHDIPMLLGTAMSRGALSGRPALALSWGVAVVLGALFGASFARLTRRLRLLAPLIAFSVVLATATWVLFHALVLPRLVPWLAHALPFGPMVMGAMAFGAVTALELPLRTRRLS